MLVICIAISCSKNNGNGNNNNNADSALIKTNLIVLSAWKYDTSGLDTNNSFTITQGGDTTVVPPCERDDSWTFASNNTGTVNTGTKHCTVGEAQTSSFTWSLSTDTKTLKASFNPVLQSGVTILKLDSTHFWVYRDSTYLGVNYRYIVELKH
ncbi:hypothetical protein GCM10011511_42180 [Puia dinghuensis]|uniref:Lipocalin-like domain-containing protein n=1 Tax=Puia dinghuensis TaxID=1792502 RepID=A0A8J2XV70_9BACT|nr:hypothetical protein GCM10011511_42180 [Puia dinghuensis]